MGVGGRYTVWNGKQGKNEFSHRLSQPQRGRGDRGEA